MEERKRYWWSGWGSSKSKAPVSQENKESN